MPLARGPRFTPWLLQRGAGIAGLAALTALTLLCGSALPDASPPLTGLTLEQAVDFALGHHPTLQIQAAAEAASAAQVEVARSAYLPHLDVSAQVNLGTGNVLRGGLFPLSNIPSISGPPTGRGLGDSAAGSLIGAGASWDALGLVASMAQVDASLAAESQARAATESRRLEVAYAAADRFLDLLSLQAVVRAARTSVERAQVFATIVQALVNQSLRPGADGARAEAELALASTQLIRAERDEAVGRAALARALGAADRDVSIAPGRLQEILPGELRPASAKNPVLAEAGAAVLVAQARRRAVALQYLPRLDVLAALWARGSGLTSGALGPSPGDGLVPDTPNWVLGLVLTWPVLDLLKVRARTRVEAARARQAGAAQADIAQAVETQVRSARDILWAARRVAPHAATELAAARSAEAQAAARYRSGLTTVVEVAEAQRLLAQAERDDAVERISTWRALLLLARAVGDLAPFLDAVAAGGR